MSIQKRVKAVFKKPENNLEKILPDLQDLAVSLMRIAKQIDTDPLTKVVFFYDVVSIWHDRGLLHVIESFKEVNYGQFDKLIELLEKLQAFFVACGRSQYGWNRTAKAEVVTDDKVYLGEIYGLFTHPVSYWKAHKDEPKGGFGFMGMDNLNAYDVVSKHASRFVLATSFEMVKLIREIQKISDSH